MERFTYKDASGNWVIACNKFWNYLKLKLPAHLKGDSVDRLAAYENTGLEPQEIKQIVELFHSYRHICGETPPDRLRELVEADRDGRCVVLPCPVGTTVYMPFCSGIVEKKIGQFHINGYTNPRIWADIDCDWATTQRVRWDLAFGKTVFLTREAAEAALKGEKDA